MAVKFSARLASAALKVLWAAVVFSTSAHAQDIPELAPIAPESVAAAPQPISPAPDSVPVAPELAPLAPQTPLKADAGVVKTRWGKKMLSVDGRATPLFWADGIFKIDELDEYKRSGFNTVVVRLGWWPAPDGALTTADLQPQRIFAGEAAQRGLQIIYALPPAPREEGDFRINADSSAYITLWTSWVEAAITQLKDTPNLRGWMLPDDPRSLSYFDDVGWNRWLRANYGDLNAVNREWKAAFDSFDAMTLEATQQMIGVWRGPAPLGDRFTPDDVIRRAQAAGQKPPPNSWAFHPASLALARFKWESYRNLLTAWTNIVRQADSEHAVLSGRLPDYAQLLAVPPNIDGIVADIRPGFSEPDSLTHNPQAIDIARRGGRFAAFSTLETSGSATVASENLALLMPKWTDAALAHGASGIAFSSWPALLDNDELRQSVRDSLQRLQSGDQKALWMQAPVATSAIVLTPLADGYTVQSSGVPDPLAMDDEQAALPAPARGLYGFGDDLVASEPADLVYALRWGTAFGSIDFLSPDDLDAEGQTLSRYGLVLLPQALSIEGAQAGALARYVAGGGTLVSDLGAGATQAGGVVEQIPPTVAELFGLPPLLNLRTIGINCKLIATHPLLPTWSAAPIGTNLTMGDGPGGAAFAGPVGYSFALLGAREIALGDQWIQPIGRRAGKVQTRFLRASLSANSVGRGYAIFAPFRLWSLWRPGQLGFDSFHGDLLARNVALAITGAPGLVPMPLGRQEAQFPQVVNFANAVGVLSHWMPRRSDNDDQSTLMADAPLTAVQTGGVGDFVWSGGVTTFDPAANFDIAAGRPAPLAAPDEWESRPQSVTLYAAPPDGEMKVLRLLPLRAQNLGGGALSTAVTQWQSNAVRVSLWPNSNSVVSRNGQLQVAIREPSTVRLTLRGNIDSDNLNGSDIEDSDGEDNYRVAPNSRHRISITDFSAPVAAAQNIALSSQEARQREMPAAAPDARTVTQILTADAQGRLVIEGSGAALSIQIAPAP